MNTPQVCSGCDRGAVALGAASLLGDVIIRIARGGREYLVVTLQHTQHRSRINFVLRILL
jgi:hypothetical protein